jgi:hypothetical protein
VSDQFVRLIEPRQSAWRLACLVLTICSLPLSLALAPFGSLYIWVFPAVAVGLVAAVSLSIAALQGEAEIWVRPEGLAVRRRNLFRAATYTVPVSEIRAIGVEAAWWTPTQWRVVIVTARRGKCTGGQTTSEKEARSLEQRVRRTLGW